VACIGRTNLICVNASTCLTHPCATAQQHSEISGEKSIEHSPHLKPLIIL